MLKCLECKHRRCFLICNVNCFLIYCVFCKKRKKWCAVFLINQRGFSSHSSSEHHQKNMQNSIISYDFYSEKKEGEGKREGKGKGEEEWNGEEKKRWREGKGEGEREGEGVGVGEEEGEGEGVGEG